MPPSIPPARTPLELQLQKRRFAFVRMFEMMCAFTKANLLKPSSEVISTELDNAIDEFFKSQDEVVAQQPRLHQFTVARKDS